MNELSNSSASELISILKEFTNFLEPYKQLLDTHNIQFILQDHWSSQSIINDQLRKDLENFISKNNDLNLIKYFNDSSSSFSENIILNDLFSEIKRLKLLWEEKILTNIDDLFDKHKVSKKNDAEFEEKFEIMKKQNRFMKEKKVYEVDTMSIFVQKLCNHLKIGTIVDIGAGRAYLSTQLSSAVFDSFNVIAIDSKLNYVESSLSRLEIMKRKTSTYSNKEKKETCNNFTTFNQFVQSSTKLNSLIDSQSSSNESFALVGLHSCGNLSNSIINLYLDNCDDQNNDHKKCKLLFNVGITCCYNLLNEKYSLDDPKSSDIDESSKFPMSNYLNTIKYSLGFNIRMLACHNFERTLETIDTFRELNNVNLWYRCVLQEILESDLFKDYGNEKKIGRKLVKDKTLPESFIEYTKKALQKLEINENQLTDSQIQNYLDKNSDLKLKFDTYIQLKMILAPIIEYVILLDRLIYLNEKTSKSQKISNFNHYLIKIFQSALSPRCHALVSFYEQ